jgi:hypothetical protein
MRRWNQVGEMVPYDELEDPSGPDGEGEGEGLSQTGEQTNSNEPPTNTDPAEGQSPFSNPALAGKFSSEAELAEFLAVQDSTIGSLRTRTNALEDQVNRGVPEVDASSEPIDPQAFFSEPESAISTIIERQLKKAIAPLVADVAESKTQRVWNSVESDYPNFKTYRGAVEEQIRAWGIPPTAVTEDLIRTTYLAKVGEAAIGGNYNPSTPESKTSVESPPLIPQLRPSSHPPREPDSPTKRKLTEEEKHYARIQFKNAKDADGKAVDPYNAYLEWSEKGEDHEDNAYEVEELD